MNQEQKEVKVWNRQKLRSCVRAVGFLSLLGTVCYLAIWGADKVQPKALDAAIYLVILAAALYYKTTGDKTEEGSSK